MHANIYDDIKSLQFANFDIILEKSILSFEQLSCSELGFQTLDVLESAQTTRKSVNTSSVSAYERTEKTAKCAYTWFGQLKTIIGSIHNRGKT